MPKFEWLHSNHKFFKAANVVLILAVAGIIALLGWHFTQDKPKNGSLNNQQTDSNNSKGVLVKDSSSNILVKLDDQKIAKLRASEAGTDNPSVPSLIQPKTPVTAPSKTKPAPIPHAAINITSEGCQVVAYGSANMILEVDVYSPTKGGSMSYTLPSSGTLAKASGGIKDMKVYAQLTDSHGNIVTYTTSTITANSCPAAG